MIKDWRAKWHAGTDGATDPVFPFGFVMLNSFANGSVYNKPHDADDCPHGGSLSRAQLETVAYACQRHEARLPGGERAGFFLGDGVGLGKGRQLAGLIWHNLLQVCTLCTLCTS